DGYQPEGEAPKAEKAEAPKAKAKKEKGQDKEEEKSQPVRGGLAQPSFVPEAPLEDYEFEYPTQALEGRLMASPLAKKLAKEKKLDLSTVKGTGPGGRIMSRDLEKAQTSGAVTMGKREAPQFKPGSYEEKAMSPMRKVIAQRLQESKTFIPHFY